MSNRTGSGRPGSSGRGFRARFGTRPQRVTALSVSEFEHAFRRELARADRHRHVLSVVIFVPSSQAAPSDDRRVSLEEILLSRARVEDAIGYIDTDRIAALLPETDEWGAWRYADDVLAQLSKRDLRFDCRVYTNTRDEAVGQVEAQEARENDDRGPDARDGDDGDAGETRRVGSADAPRTRSLPEDEEGERRLASVRWELGDRAVDSLSDWLVEPLPAGKRAFDVIVSGLLLLALSPLMLAIALGIKLTSPGPVIFRQRRAGLGGQPFTFFKFRSMCLDAEKRKAELEEMNEMNGPVFKIRNDPRITPFGRFLRKWSLDELPQLWNVFRGDMSLVGPRPPMMNEVPGYEPWQRRRLHLTGGITCVWQVSGRNDIDFEDWMRMDMRYIQERSAWMDLKLLCQTVWTVVSGKGAY